MSCKKYKMLISRDIDSDLNETERFELALHLIKCKKCREIELKFFKLSALMRNENISFNPRKTIESGKKYFLLKMGVSTAALFLFTFLTAVYIFKPEIKSINNKRNNYAQNSLVNYPLGSIVYYEENYTAGYNTNYYVPMGSYLSVTEKNNK